MLKDLLKKEADLAAERLIKDRLFPSQPSYRNGHVRLFGMSQSAGHCGGDWWFYTQRGSELDILIVDASGQGLGTALALAAARATMSVLSTGAHTLEEIASHLDSSVREGTRGRVRLAALLLRLNVELGEGQFLNAGLPPPVLLRRSNAGAQVSHCLAPLNSALGDGRGTRRAEELTLQPKDRLLLHTDGLLGSRLSERRFFRFLQEEPVNGPESLARSVAGYLRAPREDDYTLLVLDFKADAEARSAAVHESPNAKSPARSKIPG